MTEHLDVDLTCSGATDRLGLLDIPDCWDSIDATGRRRLEFERPPGAFRALQ
jgi:hypothetical protein